MTPYKCPVCDGRGIVPGGFYISTSDSWTSTGTSETCRQCGGTGIVYGMVVGDVVEGMCCDCAHGGPCCSPDENANCSYRKEDGTCWVPYTKETTMQCYRDGGCGPYEGRACNECPASKPDYKQRHKTKTDKPLKDWTLGEVQEYCRKTECEDCIFDTDAPEVSRCPMAGNPSAWSFIRNPRFTQQEMEDTIKTVPGHEPLTAEQQKDMAEFIDSKLAEKEEANMDKPRICEVLGVEVGEVFTADTPYGQFKRCVVDEEGQILNTGTNVLCYIINHPDRIIRKPHWTEQEVEDAKAIKRVLKATGIRRNRYDNIYATGELIVDTLLDSEAFPSLQPDTAVTIDEIIGGAQ